jgi:hypothetical protein
MFAAESCGKMNIDEQKNFLYRPSNGPLWGALVQPWSLSTQNPPVRGIDLRQSPSGRASRRWSPTRSRSSSCSFVRRSTPKPPGTLCRSRAARRAMCRCPEKHRVKRITEMNDMALYYQAYSLLLKENGQLGHSIQKLPNLL